MRYLQILALVLISLSVFSQDINYEKDIYNKSLKKGKYSQAIPLLETYIEQDNSNPNAYYWLSVINAEKAITANDTIISGLVVAIGQMEKAMELLKIEDLNDDKNEMYPDFEELSGASPFETVNKGRTILNKKIVGYWQTIVLKSFAYIMSQSFDQAEKDLVKMEPGPSKGYWLGVLTALNVYANETSPIANFQKSLKYLNESLENLNNYKGTQKLFLAFADNKLLMAESVDEFNTIIVDRIDNVKDYYQMSSISEALADVSPEKIAKAENELGFIDSELSKSYWLGVLYAQYAYTASDAAMESYIKSIAYLEDALKHATSDAQVKENILIHYDNDFAWSESLQEFTELTTAMLEEVKFKHTEAFLKSYLEKAIGPEDISIIINNPTLNSFSEENAEELKECKNLDERLKNYELLELYCLLQERLLSTWETYLLSNWSDLSGYSEPEKYLFERFTVSELESIKNEMESYFNYKFGLSGNELWNAIYSERSQYGKEEKQIAIYDLHFEIMFEIEFRSIAETEDINTLITFINKLKEYKTMWDNYYNVSTIKYSYPPSYYLAYDRMVELGSAKLSTFLSVQESSIPMEELLLLTKDITQYSDPEELNYGYRREEGKLYMTDLYSLQNLIEKNPTNEMILNYFCYNFDSPYFGTQEQYDTELKRDVFYESEEFSALKAEYQDARKNAFSKVFRIDGWDFDHKPDFHELGGDWMSDYDMTKGGFTFVLSGFLKEAVYSSGYVEKSIVNRVRFTNIPFTVNQKKNIITLNTDGLNELFIPVAKTDALEMENERSKIGFLIFFNLAEGLYKQSSDVGIDFISCFIPKPKSRIIIFNKDTGKIFYNKLY